MATSWSDAHASRALLVSSMVLSVGSCQGGCERRVDEVTRLERLLGRVPAQTRIVAAVDLGRVRASAFWQRLAELAQESPQDRKTIAELQARTGLDPFRQIRRIIAAFPDDARRAGELGLIIEGEGFDEKRLVGYARDQAALRGTRIDQRTHAGRTLWAGVADDRAAGFFLGPTTFLLGAGGWGERMAELAGGTQRERSAAANPELVRLCQRIDRGRALWFAAIVPLDVRRALLADPSFDAAASVTRMAASIDLGPGLVGDLVADLSNAEDARTLVTRIETTLREAKRNPSALMLGLGPYLDAVTAQADGPTLRVRITLPEAQVNDLLGRLATLARMARERPRR